MRVGAAVDRARAPGFDPGRRCRSRRTSTRAPCAGAAGAGRRAIWPSRSPRSRRRRRRAVARWRRARSSPPAAARTPAGRAAARPRGRGRRARRAAGRRSPARRRPRRRRVRDVGVVGGDRGLAHPAAYPQLARRTPRVQHLGHRDRAVLALAVLEQRDQRAPDRDRGAVERRDVARRAGPGAVADVQPARLEVGRVRRRGQLAVALLARQPRLAVVLLGGRGAEVVDGDVDDAVGDPERAEDLLLVREQPLVLVDARPRARRTRTSRPCRTGARGTARACRARPRPPRAGSRARSRRSAAAAARRRGSRPRAARRARPRSCRSGRARRRPAGRSAARCRAGSRCRTAPPRAPARAGRPARSPCRAAARAPSARAPARAARGRP